MKQLIIKLIDKSSVAVAVLLLIFGFIVGYAVNGSLTAIIGLILAFIIDVMVFGLLFIVLDSNEQLRAIRKQLEAAQP